MDRYIKIFQEQGKKLEEILKDNPNCKSTKRKLQKIINQMNNIQGQRLRKLNRDFKKNE